MSTDIRQAVASDAEQILGIYRPLVEDTAISFELTPPDAGEMATRIESALMSHEWLVADDAAGIAGYASASRYRAREAYRFSAETSVYIQDACRGKGLGRALYKALFDSLESRGFQRAYAAIALPNAASIALHKGMEFDEIGTFSAAGFKFDRWHDISWWQRAVSLNQG